MKFLNSQSWLPAAFPIYWKAYGGWSGLFRSPYIYVSIVITVALSGLWLECNDAGERVWAPLALSVLPSLVSFSLGALAIVFAMTSGVYLKLIHGEGDENSTFMRLIAVFFHFILVQIFAILFALAVEAYSNIVLSAIGFWLFCYALLSGVAAASNLVLIADIKNRASILEDDTEPPSER